MSPPKSNGSVFLPVFRMADLNRILKDPAADPAATARALLWIPNHFEDLPPATDLTPRVITRAGLGLVGAETVL